MLAPLEAGDTLGIYSGWRAALSEALDERFYPLSHLDHLVLTGRAFIWASPAAIILAELRHYPTGICDLHGLCAAGDLVEIVERLIPAAEAWARQNGCAGAVVESRAGWVRALRSRGYEPLQSTVRKDLVAG